MYIFYSVPVDRAPDASLVGSPLKVLYAKDEKSSENNNCCVHIFCCIPIDRACGVSFVGSPLKKLYAREIKEEWEVQTNHSVLQAA